MDGRRSRVDLGFSRYGGGPGGDYLPLAGGTMISDATGLEFEGGRAVATRPCYGGSVIARVAGKEAGKPVFITVRPKIFTESTGGAGEVVWTSSPWNMIGIKFTRLSGKSKEVLEELLRLFPSFSLNIH